MFQSNQLKNHYFTKEFLIHGDYRGSLVAIENQKEVPFDIKRMYYIFNTQSKIKRGCHAHQTLKQCLICVNGSCKVLIDDGVKRQTIELNHPSKGLFIEGLIWRELYDFSADAVVVVLASELYEDTSYINCYDEFRQCLP